MPSWQDLTEDEFTALADSDLGRRLTNLHHQYMYGPHSEHSTFHSCACAHMAVQQILTEGLGGR